MRKGSIDLSCGDRAISDPNGIDGCSSKMPTKWYPRSLSIVSSMPGLQSAQMILIHGSLRLECMDTSNPTRGPLVKVAGGERPSGRPEIATRGGAGKDMELLHTPEALRVQV